MTPFQQMLLGTVPSGSKIYVDEVYDQVSRYSDGTTYVNSSGLDLSTKGGMVWTKSRSTGPTNHIIHDSIRGASYSLFSDNTNGQKTGWSGNNTFTSTGYSIAGGDGTNNASNYTYADWAFRKSEGFFDVVQYSGTGSTLTVNHSLGCVPGMILVKRTDSDGYDWCVYHKSLGSGVRLRLNITNAKQNSNAFSAAPTATQFTVDATSDNAANASGGTYIAYLFAGGSTSSTSHVKLLCCKNSSSATASDTGNTITATNVTATSDSPGSTSGACSFAGSGDNRLDVDASSDFALGTGDFTIEMYVNADTNTIDTYYRRLYMTDGPTGNDTGNLQIAIEPNTGKINVWTGGSGSQGSNGEINFVGTSDIASGGWHHVAVVRLSGIVTLYVDGVKENSESWQTNVTANSGSPRPRIGSYNGSSGNFDGKISNVRVTKGFAIYRSNFVWGDSYAGVDYTTTTNPQDPASFKFGASADIVSTGSYRGNGDSNGPVINLGWEPQYILIKNATSSGDWTIFDSQRGIAFNDGGGENYLHPNSTDQETTGLERAELSSTGFRLTDSGWINNNNDIYVYMAIRRPDGYVGKPVEAASAVFSTDFGNSGACPPGCFDSTHTVDFALLKRPAANSSVTAFSRLSGNPYLMVSSTNAQVQHGAFVKWGSNVGWATGWDSLRFSWMFKRHAGLDVQRYYGKTGIQSRLHGLNAVPEMIWARSTNNAYNWAIGHKDLTGGWTSNHLRFNTSAQISGQQFAIDPTSTYWTTPHGALVNDNGEEYIAILFSSVSGISKVGSYTGNANTGQSITLGFQPRLLIVKNATGTADDWTTGWYIWDTGRGWSSSSDNYLQLNDTNSEQDGYDWALPTSTGFDLNNSSNNYVNNNGDTFIYYAHA